MSSCTSGFLIVFVRSQINPLLIFLTVGELGIASDSVILPSEMAEIRQIEAKNAADSLHASLVILSFPDLHLPFVPLEKLIASVLPIIRDNEIDALFSFDPYENTRSIDHPDHNVAGLVAKHVGAASDVKHFMPESKSMKNRPELYLWTSDLNEADYIFPASETVNSKRKKYMSKYYKSQFKPEKRNEWVTFFDNMSEAYIKVR